MLKVCQVGRRARSADGVSSTVQDLLSTILVRPWTQHLSLFSAKNLHTKTRAKERSLIMIRNPLPIFRQRLLQLATRRLKPHHLSKSSSHRQVQAPRFVSTRIPKQLSPCSTSCHTQATYLILATGYSQRTLRYTPPSNPSRAEARHSTTHHCALRLCAMRTRSSGLRGGRRCVDACSG